MASSCPPRFHGRETIREGYYRALGLAANLGLDVSAYSRIVYDWLISSAERIP